MKKIIFTLVVSMLALSACGGGTPGEVIEAKDAWVRAAGVMKMEAEDQTGNETGDTGGMGVNSAAYMVLANSGSKSDRLVGAESDIAEAVEIHESKMEGDVMKMEQIEFIEVPAEGQAELKPGGKHIMLVGLKRDLEAGDTVDLKLIFEHAGEMQVQAEVRMP
jgi:copper(I)-binding protein